MSKEILKNKFSCDR